MPFDHAFLTSYNFEPTRHAYTERDVILYALGLGLGARPTDPTHLQFTYEKGLKVLPTMAVVLAHPGRWTDNPDLGIDSVRMLHGEQGLTLHRPVPVKGEVLGISRIREVIDRGPEKGAVLYYEREIIDAADNRPIATVRQTLVCRGNSGCGGPESRMAPPHAMPGRTADIVFEVATLPQMALIYRLSGDMNPLHVDPDFAAKAGFARPILHGLATYGLGGRAVIETVCDGDPSRLRSFDVRFTAPALPGDTIRVQLWVDGGTVSVRAVAVERDIVVMDNGRAEITTGV
ncbi:MAG TPA: MaoC/PaaZ C-terminal domain-containing protein [Stellaceae bacterium]|nr:MaoC/PaaZ C-terminal domain-containing protein [Stellaceae bacterium]